MKNMLIVEVMSSMPHSVGEEQPIKSAHQLMNRYGIRHLPVKHAGELVGVISDREVELALHMEVESNSTVLVSDVETTDVVTVSVEDTVATVAKTLADRRIGCAIVTNQSGDVVGIFTATDACRVLSEVLSGAPVTAGHVAAISEGI